MTINKLASEKILHIDASRLRSGGGVLHLIKLLELEKYSDFEKIIVYTYQNSNFEKFKGKKIIIRTHPFLNKNIFYQIFWQRFLLKKRISSNHLLFTIDSTSFCKIKKNVVLNQDIIGFQSGSFNYFSFKNRVISYLKYLIAKKAIKNSIANIFTTKYALKEVVKKTGLIKNPTVIPHGIDCEFLSKKINYDISPNSLRVIYVSPILDYKNHRLLISALNNLTTDKILDVYFVGGGDLELTNQLKVQCLKNKRNKFYFPGFLKRKEVFKLMKSCDIAVFLSSVECFGITLLEYMRMGMPIVCSSKSSLPETLQKGGFLVDPFDEISITQAISSLISNKKQRLKLANEAYDQSLKYSWEKTVKETYSFLDKIYEDYCNDKPNIKYK